MPLYRVIDRATYRVRAASVADAGDRVRRRLTEGVEPVERSIVPFAVPENVWGMCVHCRDPIALRDDYVWVDENGLQSCAPFADQHEPDGFPPQPTDRV